MRAVSGELSTGHTESVRHEWRETDTSVGDVLTDIAKRVLWPENTAANLAALSGCSVRQAERYLGGREWSGDAVAAVMGEILKRRGMRNIKVVPKRP
jgi:hypothetical protein